MDDHLKSKQHKKMHQKYNEKYGLDDETERQIQEEYD